MNELLHLSYGFEVRALADEKRSVDVIASTAAIDSYGEIVAQDWDLTRYAKNPVVLYGHNSWDMPIGFASNVRVEDGKLLATLNIVDERASARAEQVWQGIKQGSLRAVSVGFRTKNKPQSLDVAGKPTLVLTGNELIEISVVPIPANPEALALEAKAFATIRALIEGATTEKTPMSTILLSLVAVLGLSSTATEAEVIDHARALGRRAESSEGNTKKLLEALGTDSVEKGLGIIEAGKSAVSTASEQAKRLDELERANLISKAKAEGKLTPHAEKGLEGKSLDFVKGFIELQTPIPALVQKGVKEPAHVTGPLEWRGKKYSELTFSEKHELSDENPELYRAMRAAEGLDDE
jgi:HK97 family phage prohead protease